MFALSWSLQFFGSFPKPNGEHYSFAFWNDVQVEFSSYIVLIYDLRSRYAYTVYLWFWMKKRLFSIEDVLYALQVKAQCGPKIL